jgi:hypothetical protein
MSFRAVFWMVTEALAELAASIFRKEIYYLKIRGRIFV